MVEVVSGVDFSALDTVSPGDRIEVRFRPNGVQFLIYITTMSNNKVLVVEDDVLKKLGRIRHNWSWGWDENRTMSFVAGPLWSPVAFKGWMRVALESLQIHRISSRG